MERCYYMRTRGNAEESIDWCDLEDCICVLMSGDECVEYEEFIKETKL